MWSMCVLIAGDLLTSNGSIIWVGYRSALNILKLENRTAENSAHIIDVVVLLKEYQKLFIEEARQGIWIRDIKFFSPLHSIMIGARARI